MPRTTHRIIFEDASTLAGQISAGVDLVLTSPPYPMIEMWDECFSSQDGAIRGLLEQADAEGAFERMHRLLDRVWRQCIAVIKDNGFICINIGDAVRTFNGDFKLFPNHSRITSFFHENGFHQLPSIIWRKPANSPNKFMGSGMLPAGAYVTLEHEYILIFRKGGKRLFETESQKKIRRESAIFWEERNKWYSDVWMDLRGISQNLTNGSRTRSAAFPFDLAYRLVAMYSVKGDLVLDPFVGTGKTTAACMALGRNSLGFDLDKSLQNEHAYLADDIVKLANTYNHNRLLQHLDFISNWSNKASHQNIYYDFPVVTKQESELYLNRLSVLTTTVEFIEIQYDEPGLTELLETQPIANHTFEKHKNRMTTSQQTEQRSLI
ncbi:site-specific DNA-methyltransferase [bacterium]|nr:site-specific DNA-methyltransferase [bacterium]